MRKILIVASIIIMLLVVAVVLWNLSRSRTVQLFGGLYSRVNTTEKVVALTFDDGPTARTEDVLLVLDKLGVRATFFVMGADLEKNMPEARKIVAAGHELGNHTYSHQRMVLKSYAFIRSEIERTDQLIRTAGYTGEITFRPPYGKKLLLLPLYLKQHNRKTIMWDLEPDSDRAIAGSPDKMTAHVLENTQPGSIILLHVMYENRQPSVDALEDMITGLTEQGYTFKTVSELLQYTR